MGFVYWLRVQQDASGEAFTDDWAGVARLDDACQCRCVRDVYVYEIWPAILARNIKGLHELQCLRLDRPGQTEFKTLMRFESIEAVQEFAGQDYAKAIVPPRARELLRRYDSRAEHFEIREIVVAAAAGSPQESRTRQSA